MRVRHVSQGESRLSRAIAKALRGQGAFVFKVHGSALMMAGLPDLIACYHGKYLGLETKMPEGKDPTPIQLLRHQQIRKAGGHVVVVRTVQQALDALAAL